MREKFHSTFRANQRVRNLLHFDSSNSGQATKTAPNKGSSRPNIEISPTCCSQNPGGGRSSYRRTGRERRKEIGLTDHDQRAHAYPEGRSSDCGALKVPTEFCEIPLHFLTSTRPEATEERFETRR